MLSSLVYKYVCPRCELGYIGSTSRNLLTRVAEHAGVSYRTGVPLNPPHSSIRNHNLESIPTIQLKNFTILGMSANDENLKVLESLHTVFIKKTALNNMQSAYPLQTVRI